MLRVGCRVRCVLVAVCVLFAAVSRVLLSVVCCCMMVVAWCCILLIVCCLLFVVCCVVCVLFVRCVLLVGWLLANC